MKPINLNKTVFGFIITLMITLQMQMKLGSLPYKTKQFFLVLVKLSIVFGAGYFIYEKLANNSELSFSNFVQFTGKNNVFAPKNITFLLIFTIFNWFFEILKWQKLISIVQNISFKNAMEQSLGALTASLFTPNRIGEYGAKAIFYDSNYRKKVMLINLISNMLQMTTTLILGSIGFIIFVSTYDITVDYYKIGRLVILALLIIVFFGFGIAQNRFKIKGFSISSIKTFIIDFSSRKLILGALLSFLRYGIFSFQFYYILHLFNVNIGYLDAMVVITSMYLLASIIPSIFIFDVIIKGSIAVYLFSFLDINPLITLCTITLMWLLNFAIPSCFGSFYVLNFKLSKQE